MILLDTNVVSELIKSTPSAAVRAWVLEQGPHQLFTSSITHAEILYGIERLPRGRRKEQLQAAVADLFSTFQDHVIAFDAEAATQYAAVVSGRGRLGLPIDGFDAQIAAICRVHGASLATRNVKDFQSTGIDLINPWPSE